MTVTSDQAALSVVRTPFTSSQPQRLSSPTTTGAMKYGDVDGAASGTGNYMSPSARSPTPATPMRMPRKVGKYQAFRMRTPAMRQWTPKNIWPMRYP